MSRIFWEERDINGFYYVLVPQNISPNDLITCAEAAKMTAEAISTWRNRCADGQILGAFKKGKTWLIPAIESDYLTGNERDDFVEILAYRIARYYWVNSIIDDPTDNRIGQWIRQTLSDLVNYGRLPLWFNTNYASKLFQPTKDAFEQIRNTLA